MKLRRGSRVRAAALIALALPAGAARAGASAQSAREAARAYRAVHELAILQELSALLAIPNVASDRENIRRNAAQLTAMLGRRGLRAELLELRDSPPAVLGELATPGAKRTVVLYAHYDGQPVEPSQWTGSPWTPVLRDAPLERGGREVAWQKARAPLDREWRLYARSASDDKAPIVAILAALDALRQARIPLSVNLKLFLEGEEEAGSPHLPELLRVHADRLRADLWLLCDGPVHPTRRMQLYFGARGIADVEITAYGPARRLHSGHYGNWAPNPAVELAHLITGLRDREGEIAIPGFSEDVRPLTDQEKRAIAEAPEVETALRQELGLGRTEGAGEALAALILRPALNLRGIASGQVGERATNSIPTEATASIDFRLVPDQTPGKVRRRVEQHLESQGYFLVRETPDLAVRLARPRVLKVIWGPGYPAARTPLDLPVSSAVSRVVAEAVGGAVIRLPSLGGSVPMHLFTDLLEAPVVGVPIVNHDNNQHAANENLRVGNLWDGIEVFAALLARLGEEWR
jgi:acetylornithine deacetylase/succinyl-diaminopimelate desuccinylase-like protein